jgi:hypothetical protein
VLTNAILAATDLVPIAGFALLMVPLGYLIGRLSRLPLTAQRLAVSGVVTTGTALGVIINDQAVLIAYVDANDCGLPGPVSAISVAALVYVLLVTPMVAGTMWLVGSGRQRRWLAILMLGVPFVALLPGVVDTSDRVPTFAVLTALLLAYGVGVASRRSRYPPHRRARLPRAGVHIGQPLWSG